jgi:hypothetical protein
MKRPRAAGGLGRQRIRYRPSTNGRRSLGAFLMGLRPGISGGRGLEAYRLLWHRLLCSV